MGSKPDRARTSRGGSPKPVLGDGVLDGHMCGGVQIDGDGGAPVGSFINQKGYILYVYL